MASIERTAYPRFRRLVTARELASLTPGVDELAWVRERTRSDSHMLALLLALKCFQRLGYFPNLVDIPQTVIDHLRRCLGLPGDVGPTRGERVAIAHRELVRERVGVTYDPERARVVAADAVRSAAGLKNNPADLINVALEMLVKASLELPAYRTLDDMASRIRGEVNTAIFERIVARMSLADRAALEALLGVVGLTGKSAFNRLKQVAGRASWSAFRQQVEHLAWVDSLGDSHAWLQGVAPTKIADFAGEAAAADAGVMGDVAPLKRTALLACLVHTARMGARDDLAEMFCKRMASITKRAKDELAAIQAHEVEISERLIGTYRDVLVHLDPRTEAPHATPSIERARAVVETAGGFDGQLADIEAVSAHHANNYMPLVARHWRKDRATMFAVLRTVELEATSAERSVLDAVEHAVAHSQLTRDYIPYHLEGTIVDLSFASEQWQRLIQQRDHPGQLNRRHFEACVFSYLAEELRTGDIAVKGSQAYANWAAQLLPWAECEGLLGDFCEEVGLPGSAAEFTEALRTRLKNKAAEVDRGYPTNADLVIDEVTGRPSLKRRKARDKAPSAVLLEETIKDRMPERTLLDILARTAYWLEWWRRFGPASGSDPKLSDPLLRYVLTVFTFGANLGPAQAARHIRGVSAHELGATAIRHFTTEKLDQGIADVVNAYLHLDLTRAWGDASTVAADGTQVDTLIDNLLAESHIRYGGFGGIAYHHIADNYIALFSHFIPCGVWEAVYIVEGLLRNLSEAQPDTLHADTQGQNFPVHALAFLFGFDLLPRMRNWKDLDFYRADREVRYAHIDSLFGEPGADVINWRLIETHWADLMQVVISIREGRLSSVLLLRRLRSESRKNNIYKAFREVGRVIRTITLLRYISEADLREEVTAATNKVEAYNGFSAWLRFGSDVIERNDPAEQEKMIKFNSLLANCVIFHTALDMTAVIRQLLDEGWTISPEDLASLSPYLTERIKRFGDYVIDQLATPPEAFDPHLGIATTAGEAA
ncbi:MAG: Tn3 family transposase [Actinomycetota bacterium]